MYIINIGAEKKWSKKEDVPFQIPLIHGQSWNYITPEEAVMKKISLRQFFGIFCSTSQVQLKFQVHFRRRFKPSIAK